MTTEVFISQTIESIKKKFPDVKKIFVTVRPEQNQQYLGIIELQRGRRKFFAKKEGENVVHALANTKLAIFHQLDKVKERNNRLHPTKKYFLEHSPSL